MLSVQAEKTVSSDIAGNYHKDCWKYRKYVRAVPQSHTVPLEPFLLDIEHVRLDEWGPGAKPLRDRLVALVLVGQQPARRRGGVSRGQGRGGNILKLILVNY